MLIPKDDLDALVDFGKNCQGALTSCVSRVRQLDTYIIDVDGQLTDLAEANAKLQNNRLWPNILTIVPISILLGFALGTIVAK